ncbi:hypothetical protein QBC35DRAFT_466843 [Podospora australis]|uniref:Uncharacterized protein n=1 Tax=Podospora australis TaxID=1536484 RepID=A0AAN6WL91_9PEZI|nr:hypothetical protein QBC35DRAFT_466843 [Podospora australis]
MGRVTNIPRQLYSSVRQAWEDYKVGRTMRKNERTQPQPTESSPPRGWQFDRTAKFPWRLQQVVQEESNWRGTWIREVKDMQAMVWETERVPKEGGRGFKYQRKRTQHLPFTPKTSLSDGGQDDLMAWTGKS